MTKHDLPRVHRRILRVMNDLLDRFIAPPRQVPMSARADIAQPTFDLIADPRASKPASRPHQF